MKESNGSAQNKKHSNEVNKGLKPRKESVNMKIVR
jgi:hypothetical protein